MEFEKREHRPWKTELLESTIMEASLEEPEQNLFIVPNKAKSLDLPILEALERAEQADLSRRTEEHNRLVAEQRMREAIEQVHKIDEQMRQIELENKTLEATIGEMFRTNTELQQELNKVIVHNQKLESIIASERALRINADDRAKRAIDQANHTIMQVLNKSDRTASLGDKPKIRIPRDASSA
jgi:predicted RNase H-like nuclease (RuvC/YqgF family)